MTSKLDRLLELDRIEVILSQNGQHLTGVDEQEYNSLKKEIESILDKFDLESQIVPTTFTDKDIELVEEYKKYKAKGITKLSDGDA